jgi:quercetin dioxygenase-like cupin family protein
MPLVIGPGDGHDLGGKFEIVVRVRAENTGGAMGVIEQTVPPGALIAPHTHQNDVWVHVLAGEIGVLVGEQTATAATGAWVLKPRGVMHAMWNSQPGPARVIEVLTPGGSERYFEEIAALEPGDQDGFRASCERHGIQIHPDSPWLKELQERYSLWTPGRRRRPQP